MEEEIHGGVWNPRLTLAPMLPSQSVPPSTKKRSSLNDKMKQDKKFHFMNETEFWQEVKLYH
jgi:hypothetical protein